jgi:hypothetical protein
VGYLDHWLDHDAGAAARLSAHRLQLLDSIIISDERHVRRAQRRMI